jgi:hypothetical protein
MTAHARFAPSAASRWVNCPGSTLGLEGYEDESDEYANEGTAAHALLTHCLDSGIDPIEQHIMGERYNDVPVSLEMAETIARVVKGIREFLHNEPYEMSLEERVHAYNIHEDCWGTLDMSLYSARKRHLYVIDLKYGAGIEVRANENEQLVIYGNGKVLDLEAMGEEVSRVTLVICQPRHRAHEYLFDLWEIDVAELKKRAKRFKKAIQDGKSLKAGKWCRLCPKSGNCPTQDEYVREVMPPAGMAEDDYTPTIIGKTSDQLAKILDRQEAVMHWFAAVYRHAFDMAKLGETIPGYSIREIKKKRVWIDADNAEKTLLGKFGDVIYKERELRSPAQMEKIKGSPGIVSSLTTRPAGGETLQKD